MELLTYLVKHVTGLLTVLFYTDIIAPALIHGFWKHVLANKDKISTSVFLVCLNLLYVHQPDYLSS